MYEQKLYTYMLLRFHIIITYRTLNATRNITSFKLLYTAIHYRKTLVIKAKLVTYII